MPGGESSLTRTLRLGGNVYAIARKSTSQYLLITPHEECSLLDLVAPTTQPARTQAASSHQPSPFPL